jgi:hypothetical protein
MSEGGAPRTLLAAVLAGKVALYGPTGHLKPVALAPAVPPVPAAPLAPPAPPFELPALPPFVAPPFAFTEPAVPPLVPAPPADVLPPAFVAAPAAPLAPRESVAPLPPALHATQRVNVNAHELEALSFIDSPSDRARPSQERYRTGAALTTTSGGLKRAACVSKRRVFVGKCG